MQLRIRYCSKRKIKTTFVTRTDILEIERETRKTTGEEA